MGERHSPRASRFRFTVSVVLLVLTGVLVIAGVLARYVHSDLLDTDHYVEIVGPLATEPAIQDAVTDQVSAAILARLDDTALANDLATALADADPDSPRLRAALRTLPALLRAEIDDLVHQTTESVVRSDRFAELWTAANRGAHTAVSGVLTGSGPLEVEEDGTVRVPLDQVAEAVRQRLAERGVDVPGEPGTLTAQVVVFQDERIAQAQRWTRLLDRAATLLPVIALLLAILAIVIAPPGTRRRAVALHGAILIAAMALLAVAIALGRHRYLSAVPLDPEVARLLFDTVTDPVRGKLRSVAAYGAFLVVFALVTGPSRPARAVRARISAGWAAVLRRPGLSSWGVVGLAALVLVFWNSPSIRVLVTVAAVACACVLTILLLARRAATR
ncbi:hypothetical protein [Nocardia sp. AG03]|uniref:hypothetical protein n=1 Tax=Nocardia sp. AG03 TaxID=3025312 RepID=UPI0024182558|nr:hypothetical protein [Nocardia sp. AG03]